MSERTVCTKSVNYGYIYEEEDAADAVQWVDGVLDMCDVYAVKPNSYRPVKITVELIDNIPAEVEDE